MRTHTTRPWANATLSFYAATAGSDGGYYRLTNVSLGRLADGSITTTECEDPLAPAAGAGPDSASLLLNGDFSAGLASWFTFGTISWQIAGGVFEFIRNAGQPGGVVAQNTGQFVAANDIVRATFDLGNSSPVWKRVTVLLHDADFSDLTACTFWIPPGQPLSPYVVRGFATKSWTNAMLSVYGATVGAEPWIRFDNAVLRRTPSVFIGEVVDTAAAAERRTGSSSAPPAQRRGDSHR
jgi:hypothetical protein